MDIRFVVDDFFQLLRKIPANMTTKYLYFGPAVRVCLLKPMFFGKSTDLTNAILHIRKKLICAGAYSIWGIRFFIHTNPLFIIWGAPLCKRPTPRRLS